MKPAVTQVARRRRSAASLTVFHRNVLLVSVVALLMAVPLHAREKNHMTYGEGLIVNVPLPESEVELVVADVAQNGIIRGTKEYNKDEFVSGAQAASSSSVFPEWTEGGKIFYKVRTEALDPRNFKDSGDAGTLVVRYVVKPQGDKNTILRIDALFQEDFRKSVHQSDGSVENAEYKDIQEHLEAIEVMKKQDVEVQKERQEMAARKKRAADANENNAFPTGDSSSRDDNPAAMPAATQPQTTVPQAAQPSVPTPQKVEPITSAPPAAQTEATAISQPALQLQPGQTLKQHVEELRKQVARIVKAPGAPLKSAPFHTASNLQTLTTGTEVLILISTPYWYGIETHDGQHGWIMRDQLEQQP